MAFHLRLLDRNAYDAAVTDLNRVAGGDAAVLGNIIDECSSGIRSDEFLHWNGSSAWLIEMWSETLRNARGNASADTASTVAPIVIAVRAMPLFQYSYLSGPQPSPNLVVLGEDDGGLYGLMRDSDRWFDPLFIDRFQGELERFAVGDNMFLLEHDDLQKLRAAVETVKIPSEAGRPGYFASVAQSTRERLLALVERSRAIAVSD